MTDLERINQTLDAIFHEEGARIVFWNDPEREFQNILPFLRLDDVTTLRLDEAAALEIKIRLEREDPVGKYLLYSPTEEPEHGSDFLLDIRHYSRTFRADRASILFDMLGLRNQHLRSYLVDRRKFLDNQERIQKLKPMVSADDLAADLDCKMIAVAVRADQPDFFNIVRTLFHSYIDIGKEIDLDVPPPAWEQLEKFELAGSFWSTAQSTFGYADESPSLKKLLIRLLVTDFAHHLKGDPKTVVPTPLTHLLLPRSGRFNAVVCLNQWRDSGSKRIGYDRLSGAVDDLIKIDHHMHGMEIDTLIDVMTFLDVEKKIASGLRDRILSTKATLNAEDVRSIASRRRDGHWASNASPDSPDAPRKALCAVYDALVAAADFFALRNRFGSEFVFPDASSLYRAYENELFRFDQLYRHFCESADRSESSGWDILKTLRADVESCYTNWFLPNLAKAWGEFVDSPGGKGLLGKWSIDGVASQSDFYVRRVGRRLEKSDRSRVFVIISDAFRYEAAHELTQKLNGEYRLAAELSSHLGVLPSYTALGMASLLPHATIAYKPNGDVIVDNKPTSTLEQRDEILKSERGMACKAGDLRGRKQSDGREFVKDRRVVYIYHNTIDSIGDSSSTEERTFEAVRNAINETADLVSYVINKLNGSHVVVTADHGFLYSDNPPGEPDKSKLEDKPDGTVLAKKRYLLGFDLPERESIWRGATRATAKAEGGMEFWIPRGTNRFHFTGGARFVHGGAMPQEIVVPIVTVREVEGKSAHETKVKSVRVDVLGSNHMITTNLHRFELIQVEAVGDRIKPSTLKAAVFEGDTPVTNIKTVTFDCVSEKMEDRKKWVELVLQDRPYDKKTPYHLVLRDAETGVERLRVPVVINKVFSNDF